MNQLTVSRILKRIQTQGASSSQRKKKCERKRDTSPRNKATLIRESKKYPRKTSSALKQSLEEAAVKINASTVRKRLLENDRPARRSVKNQLLNDVMKKKRHAWAQQHKSWRKEDWRKAMFSNESYFFVQGQ